MRSGPTLGPNLLLVFRKFCGILADWLAALDMFENRGLFCVMRATGEVERDTRRFHHGLRERKTNMFLSTGSCANSCTRLISTCPPKYIHIGRPSASCTPSAQLWP